MDPRTQLAETLQFSTKVPPAAREGQFSDEVLQAWREKGVLDDRTPEEVFGLARSEEVPVQWRRAPEEKRVVYAEAEFAAFRRSYDPERDDRLPEDWEARVARWRERDYPLEAAPWHEGFLQVIGIRDGATLAEALTVLCEKPALAEAQMDHYASYLVTLLDKVLSDVDVDYAALYEPIASHHGPVLSPEMYRRFIVAPMRRVAECLEGHGIAVRFLFSVGRVRELIPVWLDAGMNGLTLQQAGACGVDYAGLRSEFGADLRLMGGVDWRAVMEGPAAIDHVLETTVRPLLEQGGYVPYLDDTVRVNMPFDHYAYYRDRLDALVGHVFG